MINGAVYGRYKIIIKFCPKLYKNIILSITLLGNLGFDVTGFIAGLGIIGFIIGFATKDIFSNLAAGLLILITKPYKVDDEIEAAGIKGSVQEINMTFTVLISEKTQYIVLPNSKYGVDQ